jgi:hypothetical protein
VGPLCFVRAIPIKRERAAGKRLYSPGYWPASVAPRPARIHEGALLFVTDISFTYGDSPYKRDWGGRMPEGPRLSRAAVSAPHLIPHHETFSTSIQPPYSSTKG